MGIAFRAEHEGTTGADWRRWDRVMRLVYVQAVAGTSNNLLADRVVTDAKASNPYIPKNNTKIGDLVDAIDKFYATPENRPIEVLTAMTIVRDKFNGASAKLHRPAKSFLIELLIRSSGRSKSEIGRRRP